MPSDRHRPTRILVVEDHEDTLQLYTTYLEYEGFRVFQARSGRDALQQARTHRPDLIVMDLNLPGLDGWSATRTLKASPDTAGIPVIAVSGHALLDDRGHAREAGCDLFLPKPCLPEDLARVIRRLLRPTPGGATRKAS